MSRLSCCALASLVVFSTGISAHGQTLPNSPPSINSPPATQTAASSTDQLIRQLGDNDPALRDAADQQLRALGWPAMSPIIIAWADATDPEIKGRLAAIAVDLAWNTQGLSPAATELVRYYREHKEWPRHGPNTNYRFEAPDASRVIRCGLTITDPQTLAQDLWLQQSSIVMLRRAADLKKHGQWEQLQWESLGCDDLPSGLDLVPAHDDGGQFLKALFALERIYASNASLQRNTTLDPWLIALTAATGDTQRALELASTLRCGDYMVQIYADRQDWPMLAGYPVSNESANISSFISAAGLLYSGKIAEANALIESHINAYAGDAPIQWQLLLVGPIDLLNQTAAKRDTDTYLQLLLLQRRYADALQFQYRSGQDRQIRRVKPTSAISFRDGRDADPGGFAASLDARLLLALVKVNEIDRARAEIKRLDALGAVPNRLNQADLLLGNRDGVLDRLVRQQRNSEKSSINVACCAAFGDQANDLSIWVQMLSRTQSDCKTVFTTLDRIRQNTLPTEDLDTLISASAKAAPGDGLPFNEVVYVDAALYCEHAGRADLARTCLDRYSEARLASARRAPDNDMFLGLADLCSKMLKLKDPALARQFFDTLTAQPDCDPFFQFLAGVQREDARDPSGARVAMMPMLLSLGI